MDIQPEKNLWAAVLHQAISDYQSKDIGIGWIHKRSADTWFNSKSNDICSFRWICLILGLNPEKVLKTLDISG